MKCLFALDRFFRNTHVSKIYIIDGTYKNKKGKYNYVTYKGNDGRNDDRIREGNKEMKEMIDAKYYTGK